MAGGGIKVTSSTIQRPYTTPPPSPARHRFFNEHVPLNIFDRVAFNIHVPILYVYRPLMPENAAMVEGLTKALFYFPHLAGRLICDERGCPSIHLNDAGVRVVETRLPWTLEEKLPFLPTSELHPATEGVEELLQIQLNWFACGGIVVGLTAHHRIADGQSMNNFFAAWARLVRGHELDPLPYHDRQAFDHRAVEFRADAGELAVEAPAETAAAAEAVETTNVVVHYSVNFLSKLKARFVSDNPGRRYSTFQCLLAHLWKKVATARGLAADEITQVRVAVNGRARMKPKVPMEYFGNLVLWAYPRMTVADVIHAAVSAVDDGYFKSFVDFGALAVEDEAELEETAPSAGNSLSPNMEVDSWLSFQYHELDFGGGGPVQVLTFLPIEGLVILLASSEEKGAVDVQVALHPDKVSIFKEIAHALD
ncbi:unnamed protein product [Spirodela intermedia]|uniref:Uncharacterized protein n=1 Tax=Spirodela intermedia TaxID=51605 RepID=A0A7I8J0A7_SPIIN|nr:unnamed protein product [Spirodela intermedia]CAA6663402.1 unnamed protein product [Spirodela intermedia]